MKHIVAFSLLLAALGVPAQAQSIAGAAPGWTLGGDNPESYQTGTTALPGMAPGRQVAYLRAADGAACNKSAILYQNVSAENYRGKRVRLEARLGGEDLAVLQLFIGIKQPGAQVARFYQPSNLNQPKMGIWEWGRAEAVIDVPADADIMAIGFRLGGPRGGGWIDEVKFDVVGDKLSASVQRMWGQAADQNNFCRGFPNATPPLNPRFGFSANNLKAGKGLNDQLYNRVRGSNPGPATVPRANNGYN